MAMTDKPYSGTMGEYKKQVISKFMVFGERVHEIHKVVVCRFRMGDVEDPDLYAGEPLHKWQQSEMGQWVMKKSVDTPVWHRHADPVTYGYQYAVTANLKDVDYTFWVLKWADHVNQF